MIKIKEKILKMIVLLIMSLMLILSFKINSFFQLCTVDGESMKPYFENGDHFTIKKFFINPHRYDIISFKDKNDVHVVKRIYGLPGEKLQIKVFKDESKIFINGVAIEDKYSSTQLYAPYIASSEIQIGEDEYFVLGDNRLNSLDSRRDSLGLIKYDDILGIIILK